MNSEATQFDVDIKQKFFNTKNDFLGYNYIDIVDWTFPSNLGSPCQNILN